MDRDRAEELINAAVDRQISAEDESALASFLAADVEGENLDAAVRNQDSLLRQAFAPRREVAAALAERVMASLAPSVRERRRSAWRAWLPLLLAAAAGFLLAVILFRPWEARREDAIAGPRISVEPAIAHLAIATGPVNVLPANKSSLFLCPPGGPIGSGANVSTGPQSRCELSTPDGSAVRLDGNTVLKFERPRTVSIEQGELWSNVVHSSEPFSVKAAQATVVSNEGKLDMCCKPGETELKVIEGSARVQSSGGERTILAGHAVKIINGAVGEDQAIHDLISSTHWINDLLALKGPVNPELDERIEQMLARAGEAKLQFLYEQEIRALGNASVPPLVHYLERSTAGGDQTKRVDAARILADLAPPSVIPDLIRLLSDKNNDVRFYTAQALTRLTGQTQGRTPDAWRSDSWAACQPTHDDWQTWWAENKSRYVRADQPANGK